MYGRIKRIGIRESRWERNGDGMVGGGYGEREGGSKGKSEGDGDCIGSGGGENWDVLKKGDDGRDFKEEGENDAGEEGGEERR